MGGVMDGFLKEKKGGGYVWTRNKYQEELGLEFQSE